MKPLAAITLLFVVLYACEEDKNPVSVPREEVVKVSTPAAVDDAAHAVPVPNEPANVTTTVTTAEAQEAIDPEAVSLIQETTGAAQSDGPVTLSARGSRAIAGVTRRETWDTSNAANANKINESSGDYTQSSPIDDAPVYPTEPKPGRWVVKLQPVVDQWGRLLYYRNVQVWEPTPTYQAASRSTYGQTYSSCAGGSCGVSYGRRGLFGRGR